LQIFFAIASGRSYDRQPEDKPTRYAITGMLGFTLGVLLGIGITELTSHRELIAARGRLAEIEPKFAEANALLQRVLDEHAGEQQPAQYASTSGSIWGSDIDVQVFRLCARIPFDDDARNLYLWAQNTIFDLRKDERLISQDLTQPVILRKSVKGFMGEIAADNERCRFAVMSRQPRPGETILDTELRTAKEMEAHRVENKSTHPSAE
jgi:hypothetical protein